MIRLSLLILLSGLVAPTAPAKQVGTCDPGIAESFLDVGNVRARLFNTGGLFFRGEPQGYEVPKGSGKQAMFASSIWLAGLVDGELRTAGSRYGLWEFWPGPPSGEMAGR